MTETERQLEQIIDASNLSNVLEMIAGICYAKADHIQTNWQDGPLALAWETAGDKVNGLAERLEI